MNSFLAKDYRFALDGLEGEELEVARSLCHLRSAQKLQKLCFANGGIYIKLGQHVGQLVRCLAVWFCSSDEFWRSSES